jgi:hypothetical protein
MEQTIKKFRKVGNDFIEDATAFNIGFEWIDQHNIKRRVIYYQSTDDLVNQTTNATYVYQLCDPKDNKWKADEIMQSVATMNNFVNAQTGELEVEPYITTIEDVNGQPTQVNTLKPGLMPEFKFLYTLQYQLFEGVMKSIQARKFGATSFVNG